MKLLLKILILLVGLNFSAAAQSGLTDEENAGLDKLIKENLVIEYDAIKSKALSRVFDAEFYDMHIGIAAEKILKVEKELAPDIIVMGVRGLSTFKKMFLGSISEEVTKNARTPVLLVK